MCKIAFLRSVPSLIAFGTVLFFSTASGATVVSPSIGLTAGQTARLSVVNNGSATETETLTLFDNMGNTLATTTEAVDPGHRLSLDFTTTLDRLEIHGTINPCVFPPSLQVFDSTAMQTIALVENFQPSPPVEMADSFVSPSIGLTAGQTARLSVVNTDTISQDVTLKFVNSAGVTVITRDVTLAPGAVGSLDITTARSRLEIHAVTSWGIGIFNFPTSLQVFDSSSLKTMALVEDLLPSPPETTTNPVASSSIGFGVGQIARLSVTNTNTVSETETLSIVDGRGVTLRTATLTLAPGRTGFIQTMTSNPRLEIHGMMCCGGEGFPASLQVFDAETLETKALVEKFLSAPPDPTDTLTSPSIGFGPGQTARLSIVNTNTISETQTLSIVNGLGVTLRTATINIAPGRTAFIQTTTSSPRLEIHGVINAAPPQSSLPADLQIFDSTTRETLARLENFLVAPPPP